MIVNFSLSLYYNKETVGFDTHHEKFFEIYLVVKDNLSIFVKDICYVVLKQKQKQKHKDMENSKETYLDLSNYYGTLSLIKQDNNYYIGLDDHSSSSRLEIDEETYLMLILLDGKKSEKY